MATIQTMAPLNQPPGKPSPKAMLQDLTPEPGGKKYSRPLFDLSYAP
jgi:hypothetical protein